MSVHSDSSYIVNAMNKGWARRWKGNDWRRNKKDWALNPDLWGRLLSLCDQHVVEFNWVKGHAGIPENERCDTLAVQAASGTDLAIDEEYETASSIQGLI